MLHKEFNGCTLHHERGYFESLISFIANKSSIEDKHILEFGCGTGDLSLLLSEKGSGSILGIDISEASIQEAKKKALNVNADRVDFYCGDLLKMEGSLGDPEIIISHSAIHYIPGDLFPILHKLFSILKDGGTMYATVEVTNKFDLIRVVQRFLFYILPEFCKKNLHLLFLLFVRLANKGPLDEEKKLILKNKARYLAIPVFQVKTGDDWVKEFKRAGFSDVSIEMAPKLNQLSSPHYFIKSVK